MASDFFSTAAGQTPLMLPSSNLSPGAFLLPFVLFAYLIAAGLSTLNPDCSIVELFVSRST
jgi:hypothetical protein